MARENRETGGRGKIFFLSNYRDLLHARKPVIYFFSLFYNFTSDKGDMSQPFLGEY